MRAPILSMLFLAACGAAGPSPATTAAEPTWTPEQRVSDADELWQFVDDTYPFEGKRVDWSAARPRYRDLAAAATDRHALVRVFEDMLDELYDAHSHLGTNYDDSWQLVAHDMWAEWRDGRAVVVEVRRDSAASAAGLAAGVEIEAVDGLPIRRAADTRMPRLLRAPDPAADEWALMSVLGGRHDRPRTIVAGGKTYRVGLDPARTDEPIVTHRQLEGDVA
jgi:C-terminal processing protease CtpA/Prc